MCQRETTAMTRTGGRKGEEGRGRSASSRGGYCQLTRPAESALTSELRNASQPTIPVAPLTTPPIAHSNHDSAQRLSLQNIPLRHSMYSPEVTSRNEDNVGFHKTHVCLQKSLEKSCITENRHKGLLQNKLNVETPSIHPHSIISHSPFPPTTACN